MNAEMPAPKLILPLLLAKNDVRGTPKKLSGVVKLKLIGPLKPSSLRPVATPTPGALPPPVMTTMSPMPPPMMSV